MLSLLCSSQLEAGGCPGKHLECVELASRVSKMGVQKSKDSLSPWLRLKLQHHLSFQNTEKTKQ